MTWASASANSLTLKATTTVNVNAALSAAGSGDIALVGRAGTTVASALTTKTGAFPSTGGAAGGVVVSRAGRIDAGSGLINVNGLGGAIALLEPRADRHSRPGKNAFIRT